MTNEAVLKVETHIPINYTCSTLVTIEKGAIVKLTNPMTAVLSSSANQIIAGIVQSEKLAADTTQDSVAVFRGGIFRVTVSGDVSAGDPVTTGATANYVLKASNNNQNILGTMLEDGTEGQTKLMELHPTAMKLS